MTVVSVSMPLIVKWSSFWSDLSLHSIVVTHFNDRKSTDCEFMNMMGVILKFFMRWWKKRSSALHRTWK